MDINALSTLANQLYNLVKPVLANEVTGKIAGDFSAATKGSLLELWGKIKPWFIIDEKENDELKKVKEKPEDPIYVNGFTSKLLTFLHENPEMRQEIEALLKKMEESHDLKHLFEQVSGKTFQKPTRNFKEKIGAASFEMVFVEGGRFQMGSEENDSEKPIHEVTVSDFYLGKYQVTVGEYLNFCEATNSNWPEWLEQGSNYHIETGSDSYYKEKGYLKNGSETLPIIGVNWQNCIAYCEWLTQQTGKKYRLPSEAEWEYAARGGQLSCGYIYAGSDNLDEVAWYSSNSDGKPHPVGLKKPNELGLYDLSGNVWEWCQDWYGAYPSSPQTNPMGPNSGSFRVYRGGSWYDLAVYCRVAYRDDVNPVWRFPNLGFRLVFVPQFGG